MMGGFGKYCGTVPFKVGEKVVRPDGMIVTITRIDRHVYPVCAGYHRYKPEQLKKVDCQ